MLPPMRVRALRFRFRVSFLLFRHLFLFFRLAFLSAWPRRLSRGASSAIGQFSKFIRPGAKRIINSFATDNLLGTAFVNPAGNGIIVIFNVPDRRSLLTFSWEAKAKIRCQSGTFHRHTDGVQVLGATYEISRFWD